MNHGNSNNRSNSTPISCWCTRVLHHFAPWCSKYYVFLLQSNIPMYAYLCGCVNVAILLGKCWGYQFFRVFLKLLCAWLDDWSVSWGLTSTHVVSARFSRSIEDQVVMSLSILTMLPILRLLSLMAMETWSSISDRGFKSRRLLPCADAS